MPSTFFETMPSAAGAQREVEQVRVGQRFHRDGAGCRQRAIGASDRGTGLRAEPTATRCRLRAAAHGRAARGRKPDMGAIRVAASRSVSPGLLEFLSRFFDGLAFVDGFDFAEPYS